MKILLIKPRWFVRGGVYRFLETIRFTPLNLCILAALSDGHDVRIVDLDWQELPENESFDLVGITVTTFTSEQAFEIADMFRSKGSKVVMGGVHASLMPDECLLHADSVVVGEGEYVWKELLEDAAGAGMKKVYRSEKVTDMDDIPAPRRDLIQPDRLVGFLEATRGCPNHCKFCYLTSMPWAKHRKRNIRLVLKELETLPQKIVFFVDDNLFADESYAAELFESMKPLKKLWSVQAPTTIARNRRLLEKMAESGCFNLQMGFQTVSRKSLDWAQIRHNQVEEYREVVRTLHGFDILVSAFIMFGFDDDDPEVFDRTFEFIREADIDDVHMYILTPYPGTELFREMKEQGRLLPGRNRRSFGWGNATFIPKQMSPEELEQGVAECYKKLYPHFLKTLPGRLLKRLPRLIRDPQLLQLLVAGSLRRPSLGKSRA